MIKDLDLVDYPERVKAQQKNWIGKSTGAEVDFTTTTGDTLTVYTTRPDTLFGATYMVISPEHPIIEKLSSVIKNMDEIRAYQEAASKKSDFERTEVAKDKTGVKIEGVEAINPVNNTQIPIFISDYVLVSYGTGAIMAVPAHDTRDWDFAKKFDLPIIEVVKGGEDVQKAAFTDCATGILVNSDYLNGLSVDDAKKKIIEKLEEMGKGHAKVNFKLRDWVFSRQRYWGEPIPIIHCPCCGFVPLDESELPLELPDVESYEPTDNGESPLALMTDWVNVKCPKCGADAKRETDTMPQWAGSSWYFLRYMDPHNDNALASKEALEYWSPVDWYNGGMEHTTLHLLYSRFWHKFLYDIKVVPTPEPYAKRTSHGMILGEDGGKMSKSRGNVVNPDEIVETYGADTMRTFEMFIGDFENAAPWSSSSIKGCRRFIERFMGLTDIMTENNEIRPELESTFHKTIKKVGEDVENLKFNTAIAALMSLINDIYATGSITRKELEVFTKLMSLFAPHAAEEVWSERKLGKGFVSVAEFPVYDESKCVENTVEIAVQVNGKIRDKIIVPVDIDQQGAISLAKASEKVTAFIDGKNIVKEIYVKGKLVNIVAK